jgi:hypothetical protein
MLGTLEYPWLRDQLFESLAPLIDVEWLLNVCDPDAVDDERLHSILNVFDDSVMGRPAHELVGALFYDEREYAVATLEATLDSALDGPTKRSGGRSPETPANC